jgi:signal transduction histidine kinase
MMTELEKLEGFRSDFGANVSHEFKTPLGKIKGYAELLKSGELTEAERRDYLEKIIVNVDNLNNMSEKMLSLARFENQQMVLKKSEFKLDEQIRQSFLAFENNWIIKDIEPILELEEITYCGDENILSHIWSNLFENAIKFTPEGGKIEIGLKKEKKCVEFRVFNTGDGINENDIVHIFEKFYQADKSRKRRGSGLGLPLVKRLVELNGGEIFVKSILGVGTEFKVLLPLKLDE